MKADLVIQKLGAKGLCSSSASARLCRALPWIPSKNEGALEVEGNVYLFLNAANLSTTYPMSSWVDKIPEEKTFEYVSYLLAMRSQVAQALSLSSIGGLYILILEGEKDELKPRSIFFTSQSLIESQAASHEQTISEDLKKPITEWIPPEEYDKSFQFKLIN